MAQGAFDGLQETTNLLVTRWNLDADKLVVFLGGGVGLAIGVVVEESGNLLGETVADLAELLVLAVDFIGIVAVDTLLSMELKVVCSPGLLCRNRT